MCRISVPPFAKLGQEVGGTDEWGVGHFMVLHCTQRCGGTTNTVSVSAPPSSILLFSVYVIFNEGASAYYIVVREHMICLCMSCLLSSPFPLTYLYVSCLGVLLFLLGISCNEIVNSNSISI